MVSGGIKKLMRVALFTETFLPKIDGIVTVLILLMDHLVKRDVEFMVVAPKLEGQQANYRGNKVVGDGAAVPQSLAPRTTVARPRPASPRFRVVVAVTAGGRGDYPLAPIPRNR